MTGLYFDCFAKPEVGEKDISLFFDLSKAYGRIKGVFFRFVSYLSSRCADYGQQIATTSASNGVPQGSIFCIICSFMSFLSLLR